MQVNLFDSTTIPVLEEVVQFAEARNGVLAGNIANLDVPGYRVQDLSVDTFHERLREAIATRNESQEFPSGSILTDSPDDEIRNVKESMETILFHDGSNVGIEQQVLELGKNQFMHNMAVTIMSNQFRMLQTAIAERV
jgi:flagellar basal-body rod protein FlgB